ncbi:hypothetical protein ABBQ32_001507 [Trebouxia sp. C0010 RCD-2024]
MAGIKLYPMRTFLRRHGAADCARSTSLLVVQQADLCTTAKLSFLDSFTAMAAKSWSEYWVVNRDARCRSGRHRCGISLQAHKQQSVQKPSKDVGQGAGRCVSLWNMWLPKAAVVDTFQVGVSSKFSIRMGSS